MDPTGALCRRAAQRERVCALELGSQTERKGKASTERSRSREGIEHVIPSRVSAVEQCDSGSGM
jgi:hypothetical protein